MARTKINKAEAWTLSTIASGIRLAVEQARGKTNTFKNQDPLAVIEKLTRSLDDLRSDLFHGTDYSAPVTMEEECAAVGCHP